MADPKDIKKSGRGTLQRMTFETARAKRDRIVEGFASCAPVLRESTQNLPISKTPVSKYDKKSVVIKSGLSHTKEQKMKTISKMESSRPGQQDIGVS